jgi:hypothetical protein
MAATATGPGARIPPSLRVVIALACLGSTAVAQPATTGAAAPGAPAATAPGAATAAPGAAAAAKAPKKRLLPLRGISSPALRPLVAVIDLRADEDSKSLAGALAAAIARRSELAVISDADVAAALVGPLADEDARAVSEARRLLDNAREKTGQFELSEAASVAHLGLERLLDTMPTQVSLGLMADLAFAEGQARFANNEPGLARAAFAVVHRLAPERQLDRAEYPPKLIEAFEAAKAPAPGSATLQIVSAGTVWVDGQLQGDGGRSVKVSPGIHVVLASGASVLPEGELVDVRADQTRKIELERRPAPASVLAARARRALIDAPDATARVGAMRQIADIIKSLRGSAAMTDAVLVTTDAKGEAAVQLWHADPAGFDEIRAVKRPLLDTEADKVIEPLVPPPPPPIDDDGTGGVVIPGRDDRPVKEWYQKRWVQASIVGGVVAFVAGSVYLIGTSGADMREPGSSFDGFKGIAGRR